MGLPVAVPRAERVMAAAVAPRSTFAYSAPGSRTADPVFKERDS
jgi:hypothetical protein